MASGESGSGINNSSSNDVAGSGSGSGSGDASEGLLASSQDHVVPQTNKNEEGTTSTESTASSSSSSGLPPPKATTNDAENAPYTKVLCSSNPVGFLALSPPSLRRQKPAPTELPKQKAIDVPFSDKRSFGFLALKPEEMNPQRESTDSVTSSKAKEPVGFMALTIDAENTENANSSQSSEPMGFIGLAPTQSRNERASRPIGFMALSIHPHDPNSIAKVDSTLADAKNRLASHRMSTVSSLEVAKSVQLSGSKEHALYPVRHTRSRSFGSLDFPEVVISKKPLKEDKNRNQFLQAQQKKYSEKLITLSPKEKQKREMRELYSGLHPQHKSYLSLKMAERMKRKHDPISLKAILLDEDDILEPWLEFLRQNFALENYNFLLDVLRFRKTVTDAANQIYDRYISKSAFEEVNLIHSTRAKLESQMQEPNVNMWHEAQDEVLYAFESDLLPKFLQSSMYENWKNTRSQKKSSTLIDFINQGASLETIQLLVKAHSVYDTDQYLQTALHVAASRPDAFEIIVFLVGNHADITAYDLNCWTPLHVAANAGNLLACQFLIMKKADVEANTNEGNLPIHYLVKNTYKQEDIPLLIAVMTTMLDKMQNVNHATCKGETILHYACLSQTPEVMQTLLIRNVDMNLKSRRGKTALHTAVLKKNVPAVKLLVEKGADPSVTCTEGNALDLALLVKCQPLIEYFESLNIKPAGPQSSHRKSERMEPGEVK